MRSLKNMCTYYIIDHLDVCHYGMEQLPRSLKTMFFDILCKRPNSRLNNKVIKILMHPELKTLNFSSCSVDDEMIALVMKCDRIEELDISGQTMPPQGIIRIIKSPGAKHLRLFQAKGCQTVTDDVLGALGKYSNGLKKLDLHSCKSVTDKGAKLLKSLKMTAVNISCTKIADKGALAICSGKSRETLEEINMLECSITTDAFCEMFSLCPKMQRWKSNSSLSDEMDNESLQGFRQIDWIVR